MAPCFRLLLLYLLLYSYCVFFLEPGSIILWAIGSWTSDCCNTLCDAYKLNTELSGPLNIYVLKCHIFALSRGYIVNDRISSLQRSLCLWYKFTSTRCNIQLFAPMWKLVLSMKSSVEYLIFILLMEFQSVSSFAIY